MLCRGEKRHPSRWRSSTISRLNKYSRTKASSRTNRDQKQWNRSGKAIISREDVSSFSPADEIDAEYGKLLREAEKAGVMILAYKCSVTPSEVIVKEKVPVILK